MNFSFRAHILRSCTNCQCGSKLCVFKYCRFYISWKPHPLHWEFVGIHISYKVSLNRHLQAVLKFGCLVTTLTISYETPTDFIIKLVANRILKNFVRCTIWFL